MTNLPETENGADHERTATSIINRIMRDIPDFNFGRIDVRYESKSALRQGSAFEIIEINGVGSEATHIWDPSTRLLDGSSGGGSVATMVPKHTRSVQPAK